MDNLLDLTLEEFDEEYTKATIDPLKSPASEGLAIVAQLLFEIGQLIKRIEKSNNREIAMRRFH